MNLRWLFAKVCWLVFVVLNTLTLFLVGGWLRFLPYERQVLTSSGSFLLPGGNRESGLDVMDAEAYRSLPVGIAVFLVPTALSLFAAIRLSRR